MIEDYNCFINIQKHQDTEKMSKLENYTTELFVFILKYLKNKKSKIFLELLNEFGFSKNIVYNKVNIITQHQIDGKIPDILIEYNKKRIIIEVKVDSILNIYGNLDQIEYYETIKDVEKVYLLSKRILKIKKIENRRLWSKIFTIISNKNDFVLDNFAKHLEENGMGNNKLTNGIFKAVSSIENLYSLLVESWVYDNNYGKYTFSSMEFSKKGRISCYIYNEKKEQIFWIGQFKNDEYLYIELINNKYKKLLDVKNYLIIDDWAFDVINLEDIVKLKSFEDQKEIMNKWFNKIIKKLEKYLKQKPALNKR